MTVESAFSQIETRFAEQVVAIAESRSVETLGREIRSAIEQATGSPAIGLYLFEDACPTLLFSSHVEDGMLDCYQSGLWRSDPILNHATATGCCGDSESLIGQDDWHDSLTFRVLSQWGFHYNLGGPIRCEDRVIGVLYTARERGISSYGDVDRLFMDLVCRSSSLAIANLVTLGALRGVEMLPPTKQVSRYSPPATELLSPRLADVAIRLCRGQTNKEIAREIGISDQTVKDHLAVLCRRFGAHNRTRLAARLAARIFEYEAI
jgi:DNA-binding CsgD family transcriptional regulator